MKNYPNHLMNYKLIQMKVNKSFYFDYNFMLWNIYNIFYIFIDNQINYVKEIVEQQQIKNINIDGMYR